jgi:hypothetical protein
VDGFERVTAIADEDMERETDEKTSSVHFLRFEFSDAMIAALKGGAVLRAGSEHPRLQTALDVPGNIRDSLAADLG